MSDFRIASVDPGLDGTGIAIWENSLWKKKVNPIFVGNLNRNPELDWNQTSAKMYRQFSAIIHEHNVRKVYCEFPQYFSSDVGHAATAKGNIYKLAFLVGVFNGGILEQEGAFVPIEVNTWKGQLSKDAVISRIRRTLPDIDLMKPVTHSWDAIGIGLYAQGLINQK